MRRPSLKRLLAMVLALALPVFVLAGCGTSSSGQTAGDAGGNRDETGGAEGGDHAGGLSGDLIIWSWSESEVEIYAKNFQTVHPDANLVYVPIDNGDVTMKLQVAAASGSEMPDIAFQEVPTRGVLYAMDIWEDLSAEPYNFDESLIFEGLLPTMKSTDGRVLGIDREFNPSGLVCNVSVVKEYLGITDPDEIAALCSDWGTFIAAGKELVAASGGKAFMLPGLDDLSWPLNAQVTDPVFVDNKAYLTDYFTHVFSVMIDIRDAGIAGVMKRWTPAWNASYNENNVAFYQYAPWSGTAALKANAPDSTDNWLVVEAPGGGFTLGGTAFGIPKDAPNKELAWEFIRFTLLSQEGVALNVADLGVIASYKPFYDTIPDAPDPYFYHSQDPNKFLLENVAPGLRLRPIHEYDGILNEVLGLVMASIENDASLDLNGAVALALQECANKLPSDMDLI